MIQEQAHPVLELAAFAAGALDLAQVQAVESHLLDCDECSSTVAEWRVVGNAVQAAAADTPAPARGLLDRAFARIDQQSRPPSWRERLIPSGLSGPMFRRSLVGAATAAALMFVLAFTPVGSYAQGLLQVLRPQQFGVVPVSLSDLRALPELDTYGEFSQVSGGTAQMHPDAASAGAAAGMSVPVPGHLPASVSAAPVYVTVPSYSATFTMDAAKAQAAAQARGQQLPPMPANIDGSSVQLKTGNAVVAVYGSQGFVGELAGQPAGAPPSAAPTTEANSPLEALDQAIPQLVIVKMEAPVATITGASVEELREYLLKQPGISDSLADAIRAIGDPTKTWPIPVPAGEVNTRSVTVQGVRGTAFSDLSGFGTGVLWVKDGFVHAVAAPLGERDVLAIAGSLR